MTKLPLTKEQEHQKMIELIEHRIEKFKITRKPEDYPTEMLKYILKRT